MMMARKPKPNDNEKMAEPDFEAAAKLLKSAISNSNDAKQKALGDLSASWKRIEDSFHVNKKAAKDILKITAMSGGTQQDYLRSFFGMMRAMGLGITSDLVDKMQGIDGLIVPIIEIDTDDGEE
jgi:hypothetical protein